MIDIAYYNNAIYVLYNNQYFNDVSDLDIEDETTFRIYTKELITKPMIYWDDTTAEEDDDGEEYTYEYVVVEIPFGWTGKIPILDRDIQALDFKVEECTWLNTVEYERVSLCGPISNGRIKQC